MSITQVNRNVLNESDYFIEFFDMRLYNEQLSGDFSMFLWLSFLQNTPKFSVPLLAVESIQKNNTLWFTNQFYDDIAVVNIDNSEQYNLMNFITKGITPKDVDLEALMYLGASLKFRYIDHNGAQQEEYLFTGRVSLNTFSNEVLKLNITGFASVLKGQDFENKVMKYPTGSSHNFISLFQAFCNIINVPRNIIDDQSYAICPFILDRSTYVPVGTQGIIITEDVDPDLYELYAEDTVANTNDYIHTQFYYSKLDPSCYVRMTKYNEYGDVDEISETKTLEWNVWGNTIDALANNTYHEYLTTIRNYSRFFRPFKVVIASSNETTMLNQGNYRIVKNFNLNIPDVNTQNVSISPLVENRPDFYDTIEETYFTKQIEVTTGQYVCTPGDTLIYFEVLGDVKFKHVFETRTSYNVLYDNFSTVFVYNLTKNIVYFDHITTFVKSIPLPKQWLEMNTYITVEDSCYASRLDYDNDNRSDRFLSNTQPFCSVLATSNKIYTGSRRSIKLNQDTYGEGGTFSGGNEKTTSFNLGTNDFYNNPVQKAVVSNILDVITDNNKPKSIKISDDGQKIYFVKNTKSDFLDWNPSWTPSSVTGANYNYNYQFPKIGKYCFKHLYITKQDGTIGLNKKEWDDYRYISWDGDIGINPFVTEVTDRLIDNSFVLLRSITDIDTPSIVHDRITKVVSNYAINSNYTLITTDNKPTRSLNIFNKDNDCYWFKDNIIYQNLNTVYFTFASNVIVLDFNKNLNYAIIQTDEFIEYYDTLNDEILFSKNEIGFEYLLSMNRDRFIFTSTVPESLGFVLNIGSVTNEPVRLLSYSGNRLTGMMSLANTFLKNMNYANDGRLKIGYTENYNNIILTDKDIISIEAETMKYDIIEWDVYTPTKTSYTDTDNDNNTNLEEDENTFDSKVSVSMYSKKDIQLNFRISRISSNEIKWEANNQFGLSSDTITILTGIFDFFSIDLNDIFTGINIEINFFGRELLQGEAFAGTINKRELANTKEINKIENETKYFPFLDNTKLSLGPKFLYKKHAENYKSEIENTFVSGTRIKEMVIYNVQVPILLIFDINYKILDMGNKAMLLSQIVNTDGWRECFIEQITYDIENKITNLKLITFL